MKDLIERLESAEAGSRDLSDEVLLACGADIDWDLGPQDLPSPTESLDAALALVPPDKAWGLDMYGPDSYDAGVEMGRRDEFACANARTPALALCIATLKAREASQKD